MKIGFSFLFKLSFIVTSILNTVWASENNYSQEGVYKYLFEPLIGIDELLQEYVDVVEVTHCEFIDQANQTQKHIYGGLGSCLYKALPFTEDEESDRKKQIYIHTLVNKTKEFTLIFSWNSLSIMDIFNSYWDETSAPLTNQLSLKAAVPYTISDVLNELLGTKNVTTLGSYPFNIDELQIDIKPYGSDEEKMSLITLTALEDSKSVYTMEIITNYYIGSEGFFINSKDQYEVSTNNETH